MSALHLILTIFVIAAFTAAAIVGALAWWAVRPSELFWRLLRASQVSLVALVVLDGALLALGRESEEGLYFLYVLLPVAISFIAEQLRIGVAESVLEARGLGSAQAVGDLPQAEQRSIVLAIVRREVGVMTLAALTCAALLVRAAFMAPLT
ncbi:MAG: hypothetical protein WCK06_03885 [Actinomycetota bacterium]